MLGVVERLLGDDAFFRHLEGAVVGVLVHGQVGSFCAHFVVVDGCRSSAGVGFGGGKLGFLGGDLIEDFLLIELGEHLALVDVSVDVGVEASDDAGGFGFDLNLGDGLDFARSDDGAGDVCALGLGQLRGLELCGIAPRGYGNTEDDGSNEDSYAAPDPEFPLVFSLCCQGIAPGTADCMASWSVVTQRGAAWFRGLGKKVVA